MKRAAFLAVALCVVGCLQAATLGSNPLVVGEKRITLISDHLFRLEYAVDGAFVDERTLFAVNRPTDFADFTVSAKDNGWYEVRTKGYCIAFQDDGYPFGQHNCTIRFTASDGKECKFHPHSASREHNLGGAVVTLDGVDGRCELQEGLLSRDGYYIIDDTSSDILRDGWIAPRDTRRHLQDLYCFVYGRDFRAALAALRTESDPIPMPRKYALGVWYCRWWRYTAQDYLDLVEEYDRNGFPLDNLVFDMDWHTQNASEGIGHWIYRGWSGYTWNRELIPEPQKLIEELHRRGLTVSHNDHPHDGYRSHEPYYAQFMRRIGREELVAARKGVPFDASDSSYMRGFFRYAHAPAEEMGVDFWWLDWQQDYIYPHLRGLRSSTLGWLNELYFSDSKRRDRRGMSFSRWGGWGDHRHPIHFSGDAVGSWATLSFEVELTATSGNVGCCFWAHDIGGFSGERNPELYVRWTQFGAVSPALRVHSVLSRELDRRPWLWGDEATEAMRRAYHLRSELMPYIYSSVRQTHETSVPLVRAMYIDRPEREESYCNPQQFLFGDLLLAAPVTKARKAGSDTAAQKVWLPEGIWWNFFTHERRGGNICMDEQSPLNRFPLYVKGGYLLPMQPYTTRPTSTPLDTLVLCCHEGGDGDDNSYRLYEDDGFSSDYEKGAFSTTRLQYRQTADAVFLTVHPAKGEYDGQPAARALCFRFYGTRPPQSVRVDGKRSKWTAEPDGCCSVSIPQRDIRRKTNVELRF